MDESISEALRTLEEILVEITFVIECNSNGGDLSCASSSLLKIQRNARFLISLARQLGLYQASSQSSSPADPLDSSCAGFIIPNQQSQNISLLGPAPPRPWNRFAYASASSGFGLPNPQTQSISLLGPAPFPPGNRSSSFGDSSAYAASSAGFIIPTQQSQNISLLGPAPLRPWNRFAYASASSGFGLPNAQTQSISLLGPAPFPPGNRSSSFGESSAYAASSAGFIIPTQQSQNISLLGPAPLRPWNQFAYASASSGFGLPNPQTQSISLLGPAPFPPGNRSSSFGESSAYAASSAGFIIPTQQSQNISLLGPAPLRPWNQFAYASASSGFGLPNPQTQSISLLGPAPFPPGNRSSSFGDSSAYAASSAGFIIPTQQSQGSAEIVVCKNRGDPRPVMDRLRWQYLLRGPRDLGSVLQKLAQLISVTTGIMEKYIAEDYVDSCDPWLAVENLGIMAALVNGLEQPSHPAENEDTGPVLLDDAEASRFLPTWLFDDEAT